jgi:hypothetical protein
MKKFFIFILFFTDNAALANFSGKWQGAGSMHNDQAWSAKCNIVVFDLSHTAFKFSLQSGHFNCEGLTEDWQPFSLDIRDDGLWAGDKKVGTISENKLHAEFVYDANQMSGREVFDLEIIAGGLSYRQSSYDGQGHLQVTMEALLTK